MLEIYIFILGAIFGSFANVVIYRLPHGESVISPRSRCQKCKKTIAWYDNIPILSWFFLRGSCRYCHTPYSFRYPLVEILMGMGFFWTYKIIGPSWLLVEYLILVFGLVTVSFIDLDHMILPDEFTLGGIVLGLLGGLVNPERSAWDSILGVLVGGGFLWAIAYFYFLIRKEEGMGGGDIKLLAWIGAVLGWESIPFVILTSSLVGSVVGVAVALKKNTGMKSMIPFGPFLALGALMYMMGGRGLAEWYLHLFLPSL